MNDCGDAIFWERLAEMPAWEAEQECVLRRENLVLENANLGARRESANALDRASLGVKMAENNAKLAKLQERIKYLRKLQDRIHWRESVRVLFGDDAVERCVVYMERKWADVYQQRHEWSKEKS